MRQAIETGLPRVTAPVEWLTRGGHTLYTAQVPIRADGTFETGSIKAQTVLTLDNLAAALTAAGAGPDDVTQVLLFLTRADDATLVNEIYERFFRVPYPNRATMIVAGLAVPGMRIELVAYAHPTCQPLIG